jgi:lipopolysaccharide/colanic/teichoic acid biosynthesis glycosyltransferase
MRYATTKRLLDVVGASALLVGTAPLAGVLAAAVWLEDGAPIFFTQTRTGRHGRPFRIVKFRTLRTGDHNPARPGDAATRVGRWMRRWGLDELPQLWNVLRGEMSLVGPRPTLPEQTARYGPFERRRLAVKPGLTGWAQIHGRNALPWPARIRLDVWYAEHQRLALDLEILLRTPLALLRSASPDGAGGLNPDFPTLPADA